ncbi:SDR family NAD(P)-dependent oxidoreductase [Novosphingobium sp. FKTRR1]|uniref:SDR family NAD(P)-dependent oxidoreductase n=1 Tax=Novosphingobium sp. FKTRR1 TaxID=2879118 RepID=UPI001CEFCFC9|nr:SDR family NAD(P)-dependent oxidoreductase [Novosphingobium sp. FKTRR1]
MAFAGQAAWITGASSGIGAAFARALAAQGARVILSGRDEAALAAVAADCPQALVLPFEVTDRDAMASAVASALEWSGGIDLLINNAGISQRSLAIDTAIGVYDRVIAVDLLAPIALTQALLPHIVARGEGRIVMISSVAGKVGSPMRTAYSAAKFGLIGYADALRCETAHQGVKVHVVCPGSIRTNVSRNALTADGSRRGTSDKAIENGIDPADAVQRILAAIAADEREIVVAEGAEQYLAETTRTPDEIFDRLADAVAKGYASKMADAQ